MPRLTPKHYLQIHTQLKFLWHHHPILFGHLTSREQRNLHTYFRCSEDLTSSQLADHRQTCTTQLAQQAGKAFYHLQAIHHQLTQAPSQVATHPPIARSANRHIRVQAVLRPQPDIHRLAQAILMLAREELAKDTGKQGRR